MPEGVVIISILVTMLRCIVVVMPEIAVVLKKMKDHLRHTHPLVHFHGAEAIEGEGEGEEKSAHAWGRK